MSVNGAKKGDDGRGETDFLRKVEIDEVVDSHCGCGCVLSVVVSTGADGR
jgi:hypothetical protein